MAKHDLISRDLRIEIASGVYAGTGKLPPEVDLAERFGVSRPTVARALRDLQSEGLVERRAGAGTFLHAPPPSAGATAVLGLLVPQRGTIEIFEKICGRLGALARVNDFGVLWGESPKPTEDFDESPEHARDVCSKFIDKPVSGVFFAPLEYADENEYVNHEILERLHQAGIAVVLLDRDVTAFPKRSEFDLVSLDNLHAGFMLAEHLIRLGCRKLRFVVRPGSAATVDARINGVRAAMLRYGMPLRKELVAKGDAGDLEFVRRLQAGKRCDGLICANDLTAAEALRSLAALAVKVPDDVRVVGFDDVRCATLLPVALTTVHQPCGAIAEVAFRAMQERLREPTIPPRTLTLSPSLVVRESCGAYQR
jgi:DNA-binding LacI/PurR family transcriptional regulator